MEITDEYGNLKKLTFDYPDNFNFGYDVVDKTAQETPGTSARSYGATVEGKSTSSLLRILKNTATKWQMCSETPASAAATV